LRDVELLQVHQLLQLLERLEPELPLRVCASLALHLLLGLLLRLLPPVRQYFRYLLLPYFF
jgi:hypothetical protein